MHGHVAANETLKKESENLLQRLEGQMRENEDLLKELDLTKEVCIRKGARVCPLTMNDTEPGDYQ